MSHVHAKAFSWAIHIVIGIASFLVASALLPSGASAHSAFNYYITSWGPDDVPDINWRFTEQVPTGNFRDRVENGAVQWNNVSGIDFNWVKQTRVRKLQP